MCRMFTQHVLVQHFIRLKDVSNSFQQVYPDTVRYELVVEGRNLTIYLEKNRLILYFIKLAFGWMSQS